MLKSSKGAILGVPNRTASAPPLFNASSPEDGSVSAPQVYAFHRHDYETTAAAAAAPAHQGTVDPRMLQIPAHAAGGTRSEARGANRTVLGVPGASRLVPMAKHIVEAHTLIALVVDPTRPSLFCPTILCPAWNRSLPHSKWLRLTRNDTPCTPLAQSPRSSATHQILLAAMVLE